VNDAPEFLKLEIDAPGGRFEDISAFPGTLLSKATSLY
jgi:hypothetical protein